MNLKLIFAEMTEKKWNLCIVTLTKQIEMMPQIIIQTINTSPMKKHSEATQILHAGCSKKQPKIFTLPQTRSRGRRMAKI